MRALPLLLSVLAGLVLATASLADHPGDGAVGPAPPNSVMPNSVMPNSVRPETIMPPAEFEAWSTGKTLAYMQDGVIWGRETYLPRRHVLWRAVGEECKAGHWWDEGPAVCFSYDDGTSAQCWAFATGPSGLTATFLNEPDALPATVQEEQDPVPCPGPEIGS